MLLRVVNLSKFFFGTPALADVSLELAAGELVGLIGPNGSGKTTLFNCITGFMRPERGSVLFRQREIIGLAPHVIALSGISRTYQEARVFSRLSVLENMLVSVQEYQDSNPFARFVETARVRKLEKDGYDRAIGLLTMVSLAHLKEYPAGSLSYGQRKLIGLASALMSSPDLLLLDEPAAGINPTLLNSIKQHIREVNKKGTTVLLVEHNMGVVMDLCQRLIVLDNGTKIAEGPPHSIRHNERVLEAYFGR